MEYWFEAELRAQRHRLLADALAHRSARLMREKRRRRVRARFADMIQRWSDRLARVAMNLRDAERVTRL